MYRQVKSIRPSKISTFWQRRPQPSHTKLPNQRTRDILTLAAAFDEMGAARSVFESSISVKTQSDLPCLTRFRLPRFQFRRCRFRCG